MEKSQIHNALFKTEMPGYILGLNRIPVPDCDKLVSHVYRGTFDDPGDPMCPRGWNRGKHSYSIWRNNIGKGICRNCINAVFKEVSSHQPNPSTVKEEI